MLPSLAAAQQFSAEERARVDTVLAALPDQDAPGVAVGIVRDGEIVLEHYAGLADLANGIPIGAQSRFNIASNAKQYVALMVLDMAERGMIDLGADFRTYLSDAMPQIAETITVTDLIAHTSGIRDFYDLWALTGVTWYERPFRNRDAMALLGSQTDLNFAPGSQNLYSNSNYILLAEMIAAVSGQSFTDYADEFFARLGMEETGWRQRYSEVVPNHARAYGNWDGWLEDPSIANMHGDGFLFTTLRDQLAWELQVQGGPSQLSAELIAQSQQRPDASLPGTYGFGLEVGAFRGLSDASHIGSTGAYNAYVWRFPDEDLSIVAMSNSSQMGVVGLSFDLAQALLGEGFGTDPVHAAGPESVLQRPANADVTGLYEGDGSRIRIAERDGELFREIEGREPVRLIHEEGNIWAYETLPTLKMVFEPAANGGRQFRLFMPTQPTATYAFLPPPQTDAESLTALQGRYYNDETETEIIIEYADGAFAMIKNGRRRDLEMLQADELRWNNYRLRFQRDEAGEVTGMLVDNNRIRNVAFPLAD